MQEPFDDRYSPMSPQLALRVAVVGVVIVALFAVIFFRLWVLQVLTGNQYVAQAQANATEKIATAAPRGEIMTSDGTVLVASVAIPAIQISPADLPVGITDSKKDLSTPPAADQAMYDRLARVLQISTTPRKCQYKLWTGPTSTTPETAQLTPIACTIAQKVSQSPYANVTVKTHVSADVETYLAERQPSYPGVVSTKVYSRKYPRGDLASQLLGTVGPLTEQEIKDNTFKGIADNDSVGQSGLEYEYNSYLQGIDGYERVKVNAAGEFQGWDSGKAAQIGDNLTLTLDAKLQQVGQESLKASIAKNSGTGGAFVALDPTTGEIYASGSYPYFDPSVLSKITQKQYDKEFGNNSAAPMENRVINMAGPVGSTFKPITAIAALESGNWSLDDTYDDTGHFCTSGTYTPSNPTCLKNSGGTAAGPLQLVEAIQISDDNFFYNLGLKMNSTKPAGGALQEWAGKFGIGSETGVDLPDESSGSLPSPEYVQKLLVEEHECETATGPYKGKPKQPKGCGIANQGWTEGQNIYMGVGQGDDEVTPLQLAVTYAAIANKGTIVTPHVGMEITNRTGGVVQRITSSPKRTLNINSSYMDALWQGLYEAANTSSGTSGSVMSSFGKTVYGKTGTAQVGSTKSAAEANADNAWYACFVPSTETSKPIVVIVTVTGGGFGATAAAPVARQILSQWFYNKPGPYIAGNSSSGNQL